MSFDTPATESGPTTDPSPNLVELRVSYRAERRRQLDDLAGRLPEADSLATGDTRTSSPATCRAGVRATIITAGALALAACGGGTGSPSDTPPTFNNETTTTVAESPTTTDGPITTDGPTTTEPTEPTAPPTEPTAPPTEPSAPPTEPTTPTTVAEVRSPEQQAVFDVFSGMLNEVDAQDSGAKPLNYTDLAQYAGQDLASTLYAGIEARLSRGNRGVVAPMYPPGTSSRDITVVNEPAIDAANASMELCIVDRVVEVNGAGEPVDRTAGVTYNIDVRLGIDAATGTWKVLSAKSVEAASC